MKKLLVVLFLAGLFVSVLSAATPEGWTSDFEAAKKTAAKEKRLMYVLFTGSDWCGYCIKLQKDEFALWGNQYTLQQLVHPAWHNRQLAADARSHCIRPLHR